MFEISLDLNFIWLAPFIYLIKLSIFYSLRVFKQNIILKRPSLQWGCKFAHGFLWIDKTKNLKYIVLYCIVIKETEDGILNSFKVSHCTLCKFDDIIKKKRKKWGLRLLEWIRLAKYMEICTRYWKTETIVYLLHIYNPLQYIKYEIVNILQKNNWS